MCNSSRFFGMTMALASLGAASVMLSAQGSAPAGASLSVDVRVVDRDGQAVAGVAPDKFEVEVGGRRRKVLEARLINADGATAQTAAPAFVIAIDALTFGQGGSKAVGGVVRRFLDALPAGARAGLATLPQGPAVEVTTDKTAIVAALDGVTGQWQGVQAEKFGLRAADVMEYLAAPDKTAIIQNFCAGAEEDGCPALLDQEVTVTVNTLETQARASLGMVRTLTTRLEAVPGPKVLVWVTGGLPVSERPGGRPDVGNLPVAISEAAARSDITVYTLLLERRLIAADAASSRSRNVASPAREAEVLSRWLEQFSATVGGALFRVPNEDSASIFTRIVRETGSRYLVRVEGADADRPGTIQRLRVKVDQRGATARSRQIVFVR